MWATLNQKRVNVLVYGAAGAGKSTLVHQLMGDPAAKSSACLTGTFHDTPCRLPSGLSFIDTPGITVPGSRERRPIDGSRCAVPSASHAAADRWHALFSLRHYTSHWAV